MPVPSSGTISLNDFHVEAGGTSSTQCSINDSDIRGLIGKGSGSQMSFNEWYGASGSDNSAVITTANTSVTTTGKFGSTTYYYGYEASGQQYVIGSPFGSSSNDDFTVNGNTFDVLALMSTSGAILDNNILVISGNYSGLTLAQVTGFRYLKNGSSVILDSTHFDYNNATEVGDYNTTLNVTRYYYYILPGSSGYAQTQSVPTSPTTMNLYWSN